MYFETLEEIEERNLVNSVSSDDDNSEVTEDIVVDEKLVKEYSGSKIEIWLVGVENYIYQFVWS